MSFSDQNGIVNVTADDLGRLLDGLMMEKFIPHKNFKLI
jgi:hypothetical protein